MAGRAAPAASPRPPSLTLLPLCARRPAPAARPRLSAPPRSRPLAAAAAAAAAAGGAGALPLNNQPLNHQQHQTPQQQQQQQQLPFLETVWRNIAAGGLADGSEGGVPTPAAAVAAAAAAVPPTHPVLPLPPPPKTASFAQVMPYLASLALSERQMWWRLALAFACMVVSKAAGLSCPLFLKKAVDALTAAAAAGGGGGASSSSAAAAAAAASSSSSYSSFLPLGAPEDAIRAVLCFGACSVVQHLAKELQHPAFTPVSQAVARRVARQCFAHVLDLDIKFHLDRRTGRLSRVLERGESFCCRRCCGSCGMERQKQKHARRDTRSRRPNLNAPPLEKKKKKRPKNHH